MGIGESDEEVEETLSDLRAAAGVDIVTLGQYLQPTPRHAPVERFVEPERFAAWQKLGHELGFAYVASGPLVRSSYHAAEAFVLSNARLAAGPVERQLSAGEPLIPVTALRR